MFKYVLNCVRDFIVGYFFIVMVFAIISLILKLFTPKKELHLTDDELAHAVKDLISDGVCIAESEIQAHDIERAVVNNFEVKIIKINDKVWGIQEVK